MVGGAAAGAGWKDPVPTPAMLTSQIWPTLVRNRTLVRGTGGAGAGRISVLGFYSHRPGRSYAAFSNFAEAAVGSEPFEFVLPPGLVPQEVRTLTTSIHTGQTNCGVLFLGVSEILFLRIMV